MAGVWSTYSVCTLWVKPTLMWQQGAGLMKRLQSQYPWSDSFSHSCPFRGTCLNTQAGEPTCKTIDSILRVWWSNHTADSCDCLFSCPSWAGGEGKDWFVHGLSSDSILTVFCASPCYCTVLWEWDWISSVPIGRTGSGLQRGIGLSLPTLSPFLGSTVGKAFPLLLAKPIGFPCRFL